MSDRFEDFARKTARNPAEERLILEGIKAAREGRDADLERIATRLTEKEAKPWSKSGIVAALLVVGSELMSDHQLASNAVFHLFNAALLGLIVYWVVSRVVRLFSP